MSKFGSVFNSGFVVLVVLIKDLWLDENHHEKSPFGSNISSMDHKIRWVFHPEPLKGHVLVQGTTGFPSLEVLLLATKFSKKVSKNIWASKWFFSASQTWNKREETNMNLHGNQPISSLFFQVQNLCSHPKKSCHSPLPPSKNRQVNPKILLSPAASWGVLSRLGLWCNGTGFYEGLLSCPEAHKIKKAGK